MKSRSKEQDRWHSLGFSAGIAVAAAICVSAHGEDVVAEEILNANGMTTRARAKAAGADDYDLKILAPIFRHMKQKRRKSP